jgi:hypothetical protein
VSTSTRDIICRVFGPLHDYQNPHQPALNLGDVGQWKNLEKNTSLQVG